MDIRENPFTWFEELFEQAKASASPEEDASAMILATADPAGKPSARVVLLKDFDEEGFVFYTNLNSLKGTQLAQNPQASLCFFWPKLMWQVRIFGPTQRVSDAEADAYFATRPRGSQVGAWASAQSQPLQGRELLLQRVKEFEEKYQGKDVPRPPHWSGTRLQPLSIEFWKGQPSRLHDRALFTRDSLTAPFSHQLLFP